MSQTVIGVFESDPAAEAAVESLVSAGISRSDVDVYSHPSEIDAMAKVAIDSGGTPRHQHEGLLDKIERFFATLVGDDDKPPEFYHYHEVVRRGGALVCVHVDDDSLLPIVFTVFETSGALDIDEHLAQWKSRPAADASQSVQAAASNERQEERLEASARRAQPYQVFPRRKRADAASAPSPELEPHNQGGRSSDTG